jgi:bifunctional UDP-N-acetylglucosamine pyrophosphorylase/glucosamine-1-phosphate N-acetyltransferase
LVIILLFIPFTHLDDCKIGKNVSIGPNARIRPGSEIADDAKVGNFVEIKKSKIGKGSKVNHLAYVGDAYFR